MRVEKFKEQRATYEQSIDFYSATVKRFLVIQNTFLDRIFTIKVLKHP